MPRGGSWRMRWHPASLDLPLWRGYGMHRSQRTTQTETVSRAADNVRVETGECSGGGIIRRGACPIEPSRLILADTTRDAIGLLLLASTIASMRHRGNLVLSASAQRTSIPLVVSGHPVQAVAHQRPCITVFTVEDETPRRYADVLSRAGARSPFKLRAMRSQPHVALSAL